jgi:hypothetical protein
VRYETEDGRLVVEPLPDPIDVAFHSKKWTKTSIFYSTTLDSRMLFLSLDEELKSFLQNGGYDTEVMVGMKDLPRRA